MVGAAILAFLALVFGLAAAAAGLATTLPVWASLLIVCGALVLIAAILGYRRLHDAAEGRAAGARAGGRGGPS